MGGMITDLYRTGHSGVLAQTLATRSCIAQHDRLQDALADGLFHRKVSSIANWRPSSPASVARHPTSRMGRVPLGNRKLYRKSSGTTTARLVPMSLCNSHPWLE